VGARIDVIGLEPVASLVYSKGKHQISVMEMPNPRGLTTQLTQHFEQGYQALTWSDGKITYWVVPTRRSKNSRPSSGCFKRQHLEFTQRRSGSIVCHKAHERSEREYERRLSDERDAKAVLHARFDNELALLAQTKPLAASLPTARGSRR
jgi:hypothetical protein